MKRIILHWTAGADGIAPVEADSYHFIVTREGVVVSGVPVERNIPPLVNGAYAAHTRNCNSYSIGVALDGMAGAIERPFRAGRFPLTETQVEVACTLVADLCEKYSIPLTPLTVLTHAEVERTLGIKQKNKWDIMWLPGMDKPDDPIKVGNMLRKEIKAAMDGKKKQEAPAVQSGFAWLIEAIGRIWAALMRGRY